MAIAAIYILVTISFVLFGIALNKNDPTLAFFSSILFIFSGLHTVIYGFEDLTNLYAQVLGMLFIGLGGYIGIRTGMDWIGGTI